MNYFDLGPYSRKITTSSPEAQPWFDRGLNWLFGFNHGEAVKCFKKALEQDPVCTMAHWGASYASGPHYAKAVAHSALGNVGEAETGKARFLAAKARVPESRRIHNNTVVDLLGVAEEMLNGELEFRKGNYDVAFAHLRRSVARDDGLPYDEPWGWMQPTRHALGALLLELGRIEEAEAVYRSDLGLDGKLSRACQHPDNLWSLHGLHECLIRRGDKVEAPLIKQRLDLAVARAEVPIKASCFCRREAMAADKSIS